MKAIELTSFTPKPLDDDFLSVRFGCANGHNKGVQDIFHKFYNSTNLNIDPTEKHLLFTDNLITTEDGHYVEPYTEFSNYVVHSLICIKIYYDFETTEKDETNQYQVAKTAPLILRRNLIQFKLLIEKRS